MADKKEPRFIIGIDGGHREYNINGVNYVVSGKYEKSKLSGEDKTLADRVEDYVDSEFASLPEEEEEPIIRTKPLRDTAREER